MKFIGSKFAVSQDDESNFLNKISAFLTSKMHNRIHSIQFVLITTLGLAKGSHSSVVNSCVTLDDLFRT